MINLSYCPILGTAWSSLAILFSPLPSTRYFPCRELPLTGYFPFFWSFSVKYRGASFSNAQSSPSDTDNRVTFKSTKHSSAMTRFSWSDFKQLLEVLDLWWVVFLHQTLLNFSKSITYCKCLYQDLTMVKKVSKSIKNPAGCWKIRVYLFSPCIDIKSKVRTLLNSTKAYNNQEMIDLCALY